LTRLIEEAWKAGATKCLSKSNCTPKEVLDAVRSTLGIKPNSALKDQTQFEPRAKIVQTQKLTDSQTEFRTAMNANFPQRVAMIRASIQSLTKATTDAEKTKLLTELVTTVRKVTSNASVSGLGLVTQLCEAVEALVTELHQKPSELTPSSVRTLAAAVDFLPALFDHTSRTGIQTAANSNILVVDDEPIARRAVTHALERAKLKSTAVDDASAALQMLQNNSYDLVFLDVDMPQMNGHELCSKLRAMPSHKFTPVVFVTSNTDLNNRASSMISGGNDFIGKPFHFLELAVKSLVYVMKAKVSTKRVHA
jgi:CheY-like chemotaxis protein